MSHSAEQAGRHSRSFAGSGAADWFFSEMQTRHEVDFEEENKRRGTMGRSWATSRSGLHFATLAPRGALGDSSSTSSLLFLLSLSLSLLICLSFDLPISIRLVFFYSAFEYLPPAHSVPDEVGTACVVFFFFFKTVQTKR